MATYYVIETRTPAESEYSNIYNRDWNEEAIGLGNCFATEAEAWTAAEQLPEHGDDWAAAEYRVVERDSDDSGPSDGCSEFFAEQFG